ncbi:MAG: hypothetical protein IT285_10140 [Bdellovibrionales bacterium]|nr:hypothetical protein [Bdellovibrionales bacterium]
MFSPTDMPVHLVGKYLETARRSIRIATYNISVAEYVPILRRKLQDGVKVELLADYALSWDGKLFNAIGTHPNLVKVRLPVLRGGNPQMHNKIIVIDGETAFVGSANFTYSGLVANYENVLAIRNAPKAIATIQAELDELREVALAACGVMLGSSAGCADGTADFKGRAAEFHAALTDGKFDAAVSGPIEARVEQCSGGKKLKLDYGMLGATNQAPIAADLVDRCLQAQPASESASVYTRLLKLWKIIPPMEKLANGMSAGNAPAVIRDLERKLRELFVRDALGVDPVYPTVDQLQELRPLLGAADVQAGERLQVYFGPEDGLEAATLREMLRALDAPADSFVYVSTNFITNPRYAKTLVALSRAGVRVRSFFDRGRYLDENFQHAIDLLRPLGFVEPGQVVWDTTDSRAISIFDNALTSSYGSNHNKMMLVGTPAGIRTVTGSANWSNSAVDRNDENVLVSDDPYLAAIYLREVISQLYVYRYFQRDDAPAFQEEIRYFAAKSPCALTLLGQQQTACTLPNGQPWRPVTMASSALALEGVPANPETENVWVWVPQLRDNQGMALRLFTNHEFGGRWVTSVPLPRGWRMSFKFFKLPKTLDPNTQGLSQAQWEYGGLNNDRSMEMPTLAVQGIRGPYVWGNP